MTTRPNFVGAAAVPQNLTASLSPSTTSQSSPGAVAMTASSSGGTGSVTFAWSAKYSDGTSATALLSGTSGSSVTVTTTAYRRAVTVTVTATDSGTPTAQTAATSALVEVGAPAALVSGGDLASTTLVSGTTSQAFTFAAATGGAGSISYTLAVESSTGSVTLSTSSGRTATLQSLTDGATVRVMCTATDSQGQTATSTGVWGVAVSPVWAESAQWNVLEQIDFTTLGTGSLSGAGTLTVGGVTFTVVNVAGAPGASLTVNGSGAHLTQSGGVGTAASCYVPFPVGIANFSSLETVLYDAVVTIDSVPSGGAAAAGMGDGTSQSGNDFFGFQVGNTTSTDTGSLMARRYQSSAATTYSMASGQTLSGTYAVQVLMLAGRLPMVSVARQSSYLGGPKLGTSSPMRGTWSGTPGAPSLSSGASIASAFTTLRTIFGTIGAATGVTLIKSRVSRLTRPPST